LFTKFGNKRVLFAGIWFPASENSLSEGTEVAGIERYSLPVVQELVNYFYDSATILMDRH